jgi:hypothetical protein
MRRTFGRVDGEVGSQEVRLWRTPNIGGKYFGKSVTELVDRHCAFWWFIAGY